MSGIYRVEDISVGDSSVDRSWDRLHRLLGRVRADHPNLHLADESLLETAIIEIYDNVAAGGRPPVAFDIEVEVLGNRLVAFLTDDGEPVPFPPAFCELGGPARGGCDAAPPHETACSAARSRGDPAAPPHETACSAARSRGDPGVGQEQTGGETGWILVLAILDDLTYRRADGRNEWTLVRRLGRA